MTRIQVTCATVEQGRYVTHLGGSAWRKTTDRIREELAIHLHSYYVILDGQEVDIEVRNLNVGISLIRTTADTTATNILASLPPC